MKKQRDLINANQFAKAAGVSPQTVKNLVEAGELQGYPMPDGNLGFDMTDTVIVFDKMLRGITKGKANIFGELLINAVGNESEFYFSEVENTNFTKITDIKSLLNDIRNTAALEEINNLQNMLSQQPLQEIADGKETDTSIDSFNDYVKAIKTQDFYKKLQETVLNEFIKKYKRSADSYMTTLRKKFPELSLLPAVHLEDCVYYGVSKHDIETEEFKAMFDITNEKGSLTFEIVQGRMKEIFRNFANIALGINKTVQGKAINHLSREDFDLDFLNNCGSYYMSKVKSLDIDFTKSEVMQLYRSVQAKSLKAASEKKLNDLTLNGFYRIVDITPGMSATDLEGIFNEILRGYYNEICFNVSEEVIREENPALYLAVKYITKGTNKLFTVHYTV